MANFWKCAVFFSSVFSLFDLEQILKTPRVVALSEIGLDSSSKNNVEKSVNQKSFKMQILLAI